MATAALTHPMPRQLAHPLISQVERLALKLLRALRQYGVIHINKDGNEFSVQFRSIYLVGDAYAAFEVDVERLWHIKIAELIKKDVLLQLRRVLGLPVWVTERNGLTYVVGLKPRPRVRLPNRINLNFAERPNGEYAIGFGLSREGQVWRELSHLTHILVAGSSDSGKSAFLRSLVWQLTNQLLPVELYLADLEGLTFAWAANWATLKAPIAEDVEAATKITRKLLAEIDRRAQLYDATGQFPESLAEYHAALTPSPSPALAGEGRRLPWLVAIFDEFSALAEQAGKNSELMNNVSQLAQRSRKFGVTLVLAGQDFKADLLNTRISNQLKTRVQFRCARREQSEVVLGHGGAERITVPGRALVRLDGKLTEAQTFWVDKQIIIRSGVRFATQSVTPQPTMPVLDANERAIVEVLMRPVSEGGLGGVFSVRPLALALKGRVSYRQIVLIGQRWEAKGWLGEQASPTSGRPVTEEFRRVLASIGVG